MLNWNCLKVTVPHFTVVIYGLHTKSQHLIGHVIGYAYRRVLGQPWRCSASAMYAKFGRLY